MSTVNSSTSATGSEAPQSKNDRAVWTSAADHSFVHTLATHTACNGTDGLILNHKYVDPSIIEFAQDSLNKGENLEDIAKQLELKFPNKRAEHRSVECLALLVELKENTPDFTFHQLNHKHINMWTRSIVPFRHLFNSGLLFKGKSIFHKDCKRFAKCIIDFLSFSVSQAACSGTEYAFPRGPNQGSKLLEQWLGNMFDIHKSNMSDFMYQCACRLARTYINSKQPQTITRYDQDFLLEQKPQVPQLLSILKSYMAQICEQECPGTGSSFEAAMPEISYQQAPEDYKVKHTRNHNSPPPSNNTNAYMHHKQGPRVERNEYYARSVSPHGIYRNSRYGYAQPPTSRHMPRTRVDWEPRTYGGHPDDYHPHDAYYSPKYRHRHADHYRYEPEYTPSYYPQEPRWVEDRHPPYYPEYRHPDRRHYNARSHPYSRPANYLPNPKTPNHIWNHAPKEAPLKPRSYYPPQHHHSRSMSNNERKSSIYFNHSRHNTPISNENANNDIEDVRSFTCISPDARIFSNKGSQRSRSLSESLSPVTPTTKAKSEKSASPSISLSISPVVSEILVKPKTFSDAGSSPASTSFRG